MIPEINISDYNYPLPDERIAKYPLDQRDRSKLLIYNEGNISSSTFNNICGYLPEGYMMVFNDTKVVPARLHFQRQSGAHIEIFCLEPVLPEEYVSMFACTDRCSWKCIVGNVKRWKGDTLRVFNPENAPRLAEIDLKADLVERNGETSIVEFSWTGGVPFSAVLEACGQVPIPPYLNRDTEEIDLERYQTLYARYRGSVAAPTAGLHFTESVMSSLKSKDISIQTVCLHVGAGTFLPVKSERVSEHTMHREPFVITLDFIRTLIARLGKVIAVGTTSVRTLESLYYLGVSCIEKGEPETVDQWAPYSRDYEYTTLQALEALVSYMESNDLSSLQTGTRIIIVPGFKFRIVDVLVTNFHQPQSTLLLLISAFVNGDWKRIYDYALANDFRFLSYGDSSLLFRR